MNVVQLVCLIIASGLFVWSCVSFVLALRRRIKAKKDKDREERKEE